VPNWSAIARRTARRHGLDPVIFDRQMRAESGYDPDVIRGRRASSAGALGIAQIMPATARGWGVNPLKPRQALDAAARHMAEYVREYGGYENALRAYNAGPGAIERSHGFSETNNYVRQILGGRTPQPLGPARQGGGGGGGDPLSAPSAGSSLSGGAGSTLALLQALQGGQRAPQPASGGLAAPAHSAGPVLPQGAQAVLGGGGPAARPDIGALLAAIRTTGEGTPGVPAMVPGEPLAAVQPSGGRLGRVTLASGADRAGVSTNRAVIRFGRRIAGRVGTPLTIGTGTNHSQMTVSGNVSAHWDGNAADIPATGRRLIQMGRAALIEAGMPARQARKQTGGLYNVGGWQIIFNTQEGGDHTDHLHYGRRRR